MYTKEEFKERFRSYDTDRLIENSLRELTDEAYEATLELLGERGIDGDALGHRINDVRREIIGRSGVTNHCDYCGMTTALDSVTDGKQKFCSHKCMQESILLGKSVDLAPDLIYEHAVAMKYGTCPVCKKAGGVVEMRPMYHVVSVIWFHRYSQTFELCCRSCGRKANLMATLGCATLGWWSLLGLFSTPYNVVRNLTRLFDKDDNDPPSAQLLFQARLDLARRMPAIVERDVLEKLGVQAP